MVSPTENPPTLVARQHIQDHAAATSVRAHWGYADRVVPCVNDAGSCEYLDVVYGAHDQGMLFVGIMWIVFCGLILFYGIGRRVIPARRPSAAKSHEEAASTRRQPVLYRIAAAMGAGSRQYLLPESFRPIFGRVARLQVLILACLSVYFTIFTFAGYKYATWVTPVKGLEGVYNTRTSLGPFSDRIGVFAYALIPFSVFLANRESLLSLLTGIPYQHFQFLHRWLGYIIYIQSAVHTIGWTVVEARLYQPQPKVWTNFIKQEYMIWGTAAMVLITLLLVLSLPCTIRRTGYEVFRKVHYVLAAIFMGACYGHWAQLGCFLIASLLVWGLDRMARLIRTFLLHYQYLPESTSSMRFQSAKARISLFEDATNGDIVRLDFTHNHSPWAVGQHFYLCFPESTIWQSHPFTPASFPTGGNKQAQQHTYVFRAKGGETRKIAELARSKLLASSTQPTSTTTNTTTILPPALQPTPTTSTTTSSPNTPVILQGPYSTPLPLPQPDINALLIAGGTGITFVLPLLFHLLTQPTLLDSSFGSDRKLQLIWMVRRRRDTRWVQRELETLRAGSQRIGLEIRVFVTREDETGDEMERGERGMVQGEKGLEVGVSEKRAQESSSSSSDAGVEGEGEIVADGTSASSSSSSSSSIDQKGQHKQRQRRFSITQQPAQAGHPDLAALVKEFVDSTVRGPTTVYASGPGGMITDLRSVVARCNDAGRVWRGDERGSVQFVGDDRIEWL